MLVRTLTYNFGPRRFMQEIRLEDGGVKHIRRLEYGFRVERSRFRSPSCWIDERRWSKVCRPEWVPLFLHRSAGSFNNESEVEILCWHEPTSCRSSSTLSRESLSGNRSWNTKRIANCRLAITSCLFLKIG
ncbi:MAG: hypothetical protein CNE99_03190 [OM182 bacterium MED-G24]|uniref:Uncharacterized protein n=1 Tax=OM182 bacterium MED-G24 TaxID=1986255 RepID=A0A2A5WVX8_9GAMM|nr:MAG: hypothetical protein CNE99_03190 [OM182 bacterium MED-G24]